MRHLRTVPPLDESATVLPAVEHRAPSVWLRRTLAAIATMLVLSLIAVGWLSWHYAGVAMTVDHAPKYPLMASPAGPESVMISRNDDSAALGRYGLEWPGGRARISTITVKDSQSVTRRFTPEAGQLAPGTRVRMTADLFTGDPSARGLAFEQVQLAGELGPLPTWYVPAARPEGKTWVVFMHGRGGSRQEALRYLPHWHRLGLPVLVPTYRNDVGAPASPDGHYHLGDTEWRDLEVAVRWAVDRGARDVIIAGWSVGGAIGLQLLDRSPLADRVRGAILDGPVLDWRDVFRAQGADRGLPAPLADAAMWVLQQRLDLDLDAFDWPARAAELTTPILLIHGTADDFVPPEPSIELAEARPDLVTLVRTPGARHTAEWNADPEAFNRAVAEWLRDLEALP